MAQNNSTNYKTTDLGEDLLLHEVDAAPPPANEPVIHLPANLAETGSPLTAGDPDAIAERAEAVGEEAVGGTTPTPEQNDVDALGAAAGVNIKPEHPVGLLNQMHRRDDQRFELDPESKDPES